MGMAVLKGGKEESERIKGRLKTKGVGKEPCFGL